MTGRGRNHLAANPPLALITGGGSGGHVFPGLAVADELEMRGWRVEWVGLDGGMEKGLVERRGLPFHGAAAKPLVGRGPLAKLGALATLLRSAIAARSLVRRSGARVLLGTGGYVSAPTALGARLAGVPVLLLEPNAEPGLANRMLARLAAEALLAHESTAEALACPSTVTGVPVRAEFFDVAPNLPFGEPSRILVLGGSQGARQLNDLLPDSLDSLADSLGPVWVRHQTGKKHVRATRKAYAARGFSVARETGARYQPGGPPVQVEVVPFLHDMAGAMAESHLVISRAGAITLAEVCAAGRPVLLLPLTLAGGHQESNARRLQEAGAAEVVDPDTDARAFGEQLIRLLGDRQHLEAMAVRARALGRPDAAHGIADRLEARALVPEASTARSDGERSEG